MPKASHVAQELRNLADALDQAPDADILKPYMYFSHYGPGDKHAFLALAGVLPHPFKKIYRGIDLVLEYSSRSIHVESKINRDTVCRLVEPAKPAVYECEPLLSEDERAALETK